MKQLIRICAVALPCLFVGAAARAQASANDLFANAITLNGPIVTAMGSNVGATKQFGGGGGGEPSIPGAFPGAFGGASVWWNWTASASGQTTIDTEGSDFNTLLGVFTGEAQNALTLVAGNDDFEANQWSRVVFNAVAGTTYRIMVDGFRSGAGFGTPAMGNIKLNVKGVGGLEISLTNGMVFTIGEAIPISVTFTPDFPNAPATRVDFYRRGSPFTAPVLFGTDDTAPFSAVATNVPAGSNSFYVAAFDSLGNPVESPAAEVLVQNVGVTLLTPFEDTTYASTNPITVTAWAYLPAGTITNVEFLVDGVKFAEDDAPPYSGTWNTVFGGSHRFTAVGRSDSGGRYTSQPVNVGVASTLVATGAVWKYLDDGSDQGTAWFEPGFDDGAWASGPSELGYGDGDESTVVASGPDGAFYITTYFRHAFDVADVSGFASLTATLERDDAAVVFLNGREVFRTSNLPAPPEPILYTTVATGQAVEDTVDTFLINPTNFVAGRNVLAVEIHQQAANSSDISLNFRLQGIPVIIHNLSPAVTLTNPLANAYFLAPTGITLDATASDGDGSVAKVEFFAGSTKIGEDTTEPYSVVWNSPPVAAHVLTAVATDDQGATTTSVEVPVVVYDAVGTPVAAITSPVDGFVTPGPTNWLVTATANAITGVTNVQFLANGVPFGNDATAPYSAVWTAPFGTNILTAVATDANGVSGTSPAITAVITIPPTNVIAPTVAFQVPLAGATVTNLTNITVTFSEYVQNIDAADLLINGVPALGVNANHSRSNYTFTFAQPPYGAVNVTWASGHGITDYGFPTVLPFDGNGPGATWSYDLIDRMPPTLVARTPAPGSTVTNLAEISVTFSEPVSGVDATDLLLNNVPALGVAGSGASYTFSVPQPTVGTNLVTWATNHAIVDTAPATNAFVGTGAAATWNFVFDNRIVLLQSNSVWHFVKGFAEASTPRDAWRQPGFDDSSWSNAPAPFFFGDPYTNAVVQGTLLSDMQSNYTTIFLRQEFVVESLGAITSVRINHQTDDGFIAWLNGAEVLRFNVPAGDLAYNATASTAANEPGNAGAAYIAAVLTNNAALRLVKGTNLLAIMAFNQNLNTSSDFGFNAQLHYYPVDPATVPPRLVQADPAAGEIFYLTNVAISFSEGVSGVDAADLLVNGVPATGVSSTTNSVYTFSFPQPPYGPVLITWDTNHGIVDFDTPQRAFDGEAAAARVSYTLLNPSSPRVIAQVPPASITVTGLTSILVTFNEPVTGVDASDLLVSGAPAGSVSSVDNITYNFAFVQPPFGTVTVRWATNNGITDLESPPAEFDPVRFGAQWNYNLIDPVPSVTLTSPTNGGYVLEPADIPVRATASDNDGTVALVEFFGDGNKLGEFTSPPYSLTWSNILRGQYILHAVATDNQGLMRTSSPVIINVVTNLPVNVVRGPYLQSGSPTGAVVRWRTDLRSDAVVWYGKELGGPVQLAFDATSTNEHIITLAGLEPDTKYYYAIGTSAQTNAAGEEYWFKTSPVPGTRRPYRFWILGDSGTAGNGAPDRQISTREAYYGFAATNGPADFWMMLGDNAYNSGTDEEHQRAIFDIYPDTLRNLFLWPTLGNHETAMSTTAATFPYLDIFSLPTAGQAGGVPSGNEKYYSFDYGNIHFVCLDSMTSGQTADTPMANWLRADLEAATAEWIIVFFHHPPYTKGSHNSDTEQDLVRIRQNLNPIMETNGVDLVLSGHSHSYERSFLLNGHYGLSDTFTPAMAIDLGDGSVEGDGAYRKDESGQGTVYTVAGSSGQATFLQADAPHEAMHVTILQLGTMVIDVSSNRLDALFLRENGLIQDRFTLIKPALEPSAPLHLVALPTGAGEVTLGWTAGSSNALGYAIERSTDGVNFVEQFTVSGDANGAVNTGLAASTTYFYRVRATNSFGASDYSNVAGVSTVVPTGAPLAPVALAASADDGIQFFRSQMVLRWQDRSTDEGAFLIERSADGAAFEMVATVAANITSYLDRGLASATPHYYRVRAVNTVGQSASSNIAGDETHPQSQLARAGESVVLHGGVEGSAPVRYQWRFLGVPITGETNETLLLTDVQLVDEGDYSVVVVDANGRVTSNPAYLFVVAPPQIVGEPEDTIGLVGAAAALDVLAVGTEPMTYQWLRNGTSIAGATSPLLTIPAVQLSDQAGYYVIIGNDFGAVTSRVASLSVYLQPGVGPVADIFTEVLRPVVLTNTATDGNSPPLDLVFSLDPGAPTNAVVDSVTGVFRWTPERSQAPSTNLITVRVADQSRPEVANTTSFTIVVNDYIEVTVGSTVEMMGVNAVVPFDFFSSASLLELRCELELPWSYFTAISVEPISPQIAAVTLQNSGSNTATLTFTAEAGQSLQGTQQLARLHFMTASNQISAFVALQVRNLGWTAARGALTPTLLANHGRVTLIGTQSLLEGRVTAGQRQLVLYGRTGVTYTIQSRLGLDPANAWANRTSFFMTNTVRVVSAPSATAPLIFYRLRE